MKSDIIPIAITMAFTGGLLCLKSFISSWGRRTDNRQFKIRRTSPPRVERTPENKPRTAQNSAAAAKVESKATQAVGHMRAHS